MKTQKTNGADFLRELVNWMNDRNEILNENKSHFTLIYEYKSWLIRNGFEK